MSQDNFRMIAAFAAIAGIMILKTIYFPCNCTVEPPQAHVVETNHQKQHITTGGIVTMIDLGATDCIPCKMMAPIIGELKNEYAGRADILFIDVRKNPDQAGKYGVRTIPTQVFFDARGKEVYRNSGFMDKNRIMEVLSRLGVSRPPGLSSD